MISEINLARQGEERGTILTALRDDYGSKMTSVASLSRAIFMVGRGVTGDALQFHLSCLTDSGYIKIWRAEEMAGFRPDREMDVRADKIVFARLATRGRQLIEGKVPVDPDVIF